MLPPRGTGVQGGLVTGSQRRAGKGKRAQRGSAGAGGRDELRYLPLSLLALLIPAAAHPPHNSPHFFLSPAQERHESVLVAAHTSAGKTVVAE